MQTYVKIKNFREGIFVLFVIILIIEYFYSFVYTKLYWPETYEKKADEKSILLVADPQLIGYVTTTNFGIIERWDSDKFIKNYFYMAYYTVNPDLIIFLGDIFDEGSIASDRDYKYFSKRFTNVFEICDFNKSIFIPGDNDIGGEGEPVTDYLIKRFNKHFKDDAFISLDILDIVKVNRMTQDVPPVKQHSKLWHVVLSHMPIMPMVTKFVDKIVEKYQPHLIFSAHDHKSMYMKLKKRTILRKKPFKINSVQFELSDDFIHEIMVPTCSYRMGTPEIGYGWAVINKLGMVSYKVLWVPSRFKQLYFYLFTIPIALLFICLMHTPCQIITRACVGMIRSRLGYR